VTESNSAVMTGGEAVVRTLLSNGVRRVFGLPGIQNDWLFNALFDHRDEIEVLHTRHEQGAAYMALGAALATGELAVCSVVPGPGTLNAGAALATAYALNAPLLFLTGQIPLPLIGRGTGALHEITDQLGLLRGMTKLALRVEHPTGVAPAVNAAIDAIRSGRPRPAAIEIPMDVLAERAPVAPIVRRRQELESVPFDDEKLGRIVETLSHGRSPLIFVGSGAQAVAPQVRALAELVRAPVVAYRTGRGIMDSRSPFSFVLPAARPLWAQCDVALALGSNMRLPLQSWEQRPERKLLRIDIDPASHSLLCKPAVALTARLEDALPVLIQELTSRRVSSEWQHSDMVAAQEHWRARISVLEPQMRYLDAIRAALGEQGIFVEELTQVGFASRLVLPVYHPRAFISTGYMGTLGFGFPTALGVKVARPDVPVVSVTGDGGFMFAVGELATAVQHGISLAIVLFNNGQYGNVQQMQRSLYGGRVIATDLVNPNFVALAKAFGGHGCRVTEPRDLHAALLTAFAAKGPTLIEVPVGDLPSVDQFR
jgi:acetolactate synthase I/II/III large subunit